MLLHASISKWRNIKLISIFLPQYYYNTIYYEKVHVLCIQHTVNMYMYSKLTYTLLYHTTNHMYSVHAYRSVRTIIYYTIIYI